MALVEINALESSRFGVRFGRLDAQAAPQSIAEAVDCADRDGIAVLSTRVDAADLTLVRALEDAGFRIMDTLVYHRRSLSGDEDDRSPLDKGVVVTLTDTDAPAAAQLSRQAFQHYIGHYHADPRLSDTAADAAYADWASRLLLDPAPGQIALGVRVDGDLAAFIVGERREGAASEIVLNAVRPDAQRTGLYSCLLRHYLKSAAARGDAEVIISTQLQNYPVQRVWSRHGFVLYRSFHTLHRWANALR